VTAGLAAARATLAGRLDPAEGADPVDARLDDLAHALSYRTDRTAVDDVFRAARGRRVRGGLAALLLVGAVGAGGLLLGERQGWLPGTAGAADVLPAQVPGQDPPPTDHPRPTHPVPVPHHPAGHGSGGSGQGGGTAGAPGPAVAPRAPDPIDGVVRRPVTGGGGSGSGGPAHIGPRVPRLPGGAGGGPGGGPGG
jgi:hypothetical protein